MKVASYVMTVLMAVILLGAGLAAQTSSSGQAAGTQTRKAPSSTMRQQHMQMMQQHVEEMKAQISKMQANVEQMKANAAKIQDPAAKQQADLDAQMWQMMVDHMQGMQKMMTEHGGMMGPGMHQHMHHPGPRGTPPPPSSQPQ